MLFQGSGRPQGKFWSGDRGGQGNNAHELKANGDVVVEDLSEVTWIK